MTDEPRTKGREGEPMSDEEVDELRRGYLTAGRVAATASSSSATIVGASRRRRSMTDLTAISEAAEAATPGPWIAGDCYSIAGVKDEMFGAGKCASCRDGDEPIWTGRRDINGRRMLAHVHLREAFNQNEIITVLNDKGMAWSVVRTTDEYGAMSAADAHFIASAREWVPALVAGLTAERAEVERLRGDLQARVFAWIVSSFGERADRGTDASLVQVFGQSLVVMEEVGEMMRCLVKAQQGIRRDTDWQAELRNEMGDVGIALYALAAHNGIDFDAAVRDRFDHVVSKRVNGEH